MIWERIKTLWILSGVKLPPGPSLLEELSSEQRWADAAMELIKENKKMATIIPYKPRDPVAEIVGDEKAI